MKKKSHRRLKQRKMIDRYMMVGEEVKILKDKKKDS